MKNGNISVIKVRIPKFMRHTIGRVIPHNSGVTGAKIMVNCWITMQDPDDKAARKVWVKDDSRYPTRSNTLRKRAEKMNKGDLVAVYVYDLMPYGIQYIGRIEKMAKFEVDQHDDVKGIDWRTAAHLEQTLLVVAEKGKTICSLPELARILEKDMNYANNNILAVRHKCIGSVGYLTHDQMKAIWSEAPLS
jgi:hypothetical protein